MAVSSSFSAEPRATRAVRWLLSSGIGLIIIAVAAMWAIEAIDTWFLDDRLQGNGIRPRAIEGLDGILWAPLLHSDVGHVFGNTAPLLVMGTLVSARGFRYWSISTAAIVVLGGGFTWLLGEQGSNHIGASGVVFGYFGLLLGAAWFERNRAAFGAALIAIFLYSGLVAGLIPQPRISWEGHLFGLLAGLLFAKLLAVPRPVRRDDPRDVQDWELDEPWLS